MVNRAAVVALIALSMVVFGFSSAIAQTFSTPSGAVESSGLPVDALVTFTAGDGTIALTIQNLQANPTSVAQNISALFFMVRDASSVFTNYKSSGNFVSVSTDGTPSGAGSGSTGWGLLQSPNFVDFHLNDLGFAGPRNTVLGPPDGSGIYSTANSSIAGNAPHNPFIDQLACFSFSVPGVTAISVVSDVLFSFGTTPGNNVGVPEPASLLFLGAGLLGLTWFRRKSAN